MDCQLIEELERLARNRREAHRLGHHAIVLAFGREIVRLCREAGYLRLSREYLSL